MSGDALARNTFLNLFGQVLPFLIGVGLIPYIIRGLGTERFGLLSLAWVVLGYFSLFDLGLGRATTKFVAERLSECDAGPAPDLAALVWTSLTFHALLGTVGGGVLAAITPSLVGHVFKIPHDLTAEARLTFLLLAASLPVVLGTTALRGVLEGGQRFDLVNRVKIPASSLTFALPALAIPLGLHLPGIVLLLLASRVAALGSYLVLCVRAFPSLKTPPFLDPRLIRPLLEFGGWVTLSNAAAPLLMYMDRFCIGSVLTVAAISFYAAPYEAVIRLWILPTSLVMTLFPAFSALGMAHPHELGRLYARSIKYLVLLTGPVILNLILFGGSLLGLWLGPEFAQRSTLTFQVLCIGALVGCLAPVPGSLLQGLGRPDLLAKVYLVELPANFVLVWFLTKGMGISGAALAFTVRTVIETLVLVLLAARLVPALGDKSVGTSVAYLLAVLTGFVALLVLTPLLTKSSLVLSVFAIASTAALALGTWHYLLDDAEKKSLSRGVREMLGHLVPSPGSRAMNTTFLLSWADRINRYVSASGIADAKVIRRAKSAARKALERLWSKEGGVLLQIDGLQIRLPEARYLWLYAAYEPYTSTLFKRAVTRGGVILDIGACFGYYSLLAAQAAGRSGKVYAFEPDPRNFEVLRQNIALNDYSDTIVAVAKAVSNKTQSLPLYLSRFVENNSLSNTPLYASGRTLGVESVTVDEFLHGQPVSVIKMDIEGYEPYGLDGMRRTVEASKDLVLFTELNVSCLKAVGVTAAAFVAQLEELGFRAELIDDRDRRLVPPTADNFANAERDPSRFSNLFCVKQ